MGRWDKGKDMNVTKVYNQDGDVAYYFINGVRSDAYDDRSVLEELLGDNFNEYYIIQERDFFTDMDDETLSRMEAAETLDEFELLVERNPHLVEDV